MVRERIPEERDLYLLSEFFKVFSDFTRLKIIYALFLREMCVYDLAALLNMNQSAVSHQLRVLKQSGLVKHRKEGKNVFYSLKDEHIKGIFDQSLSHISEK
jgi:ArsR family transcriptional regulator